MPASSLPTTSLPALFISHGSPMTAIDGSPAHQFLKELGHQLPRPRAILVASAHWETASPLASLATVPETIYDFGGFPRALYEIRYPAQGAPEVAREALRLLAAAGFPAAADPGRGFDHGVWVPLHLMYPEADIPVASVSIQPHLDPAHHWRMGAALAPLREDGVLVIGSGALTHNLREFFQARREPGPAPWAVAFQDWLADALAAGRTEALLDYRRQAPFATRNHPTDEHLLPLFVALGAGGPQARFEHLHSSLDHGVLAMDTYAFH